MADSPADLLQGCFVLMASSSVSSVLAQTWRRSLSDPGASHYVARKQNVEESGGEGR